MLGFVGFADEVRAQEQQLGFCLDAIVVCSVTGRNARRSLRIAQHTAEMVELGRAISDEDIVLDTRYAHPEYGIPSSETLDAIRTCARCEGMLTDPVYEGKSMQGMMDLIRREEIPPGARVLYAHLGGVPAINGYSYLFRNG